MPIAKVSLADNRWLEEFNKSLGGQYDATWTHSETGKAVAVRRSIQSIDPGSNVMSPVLSFDVVVNHTNRGNEVLDTVLQVKGTSPKNGLDKKEPYTIEPTMITDISPAVLADGSISHNGKPAVRINANSSTQNLSEIVRSSFEQGAVDEARFGAQATGNEIQGRFQEYLQEGLVIKGQRITNPAVRSDPTVSKEAKSRAIQGISVVVRGHDQLKQYKVDEAYQSTYVELLAGGWQNEDHRAIGVREKKSNVSFGSRVYDLFRNITGGNEKKEGYTFTEGSDRLRPYFRASVSQREDGTTETSAYLVGGPKADIYKESLHNIGTRATKYEYTQDSKGRTILKPVEAKKVTSFNQYFANGPVVSRSLTELPTGEVSRTPDVVERQMFVLMPTHLSGAGFQYTPGEENPNETVYGVRSRLKATLPASFKMQDLYGVNGQFSDGRELSAAYLGSGSVPVGNFSVKRDNGEDENFEVTAQKGESPFYGNSAGWVGVPRYHAPDGTFTNSSGRGENQQVSKEYLKMVEKKFGKRARFTDEKSISINYRGDIATGARIRSDDNKQATSQTARSLRLGEMMPSAEDASRIPGLGTEELAKLQQMRSTPVFSVTNTAKSARFVTSAFKVMSEEQSTGLLGDWAAHKEGPLSAAVMKEYTRQTKLKRDAINWQSIAKAAQGLEGFEGNSTELKMRILQEQVIDRFDDDAANLRNLTNGIGFLKGEHWVPAGWKNPEAHKVTIEQVSRGFMQEDPGLTKEEAVKRAESIYRVSATPSGGTLPYKEMRGRDMLAFFGGADNVVDRPTGNVKHNLMFQQAVTNYDPKIAKELGLHVDGPLPDSPLARASASLLGYRTFQEGRISQDPESMAMKSDHELPLTVEQARELNNLAKDESVDDLDFLERAKGVVGGEGTFKLPRMPQNGEYIADPEAVAQMQHSEFGEAVGGLTGSYRNSITQAYDKMMDFGKNTTDAPPSNAFYKKVESITETLLGNALKKKTPTGLTSSISDASYLGPHEGEMTKANRDLVAGRMAKHFGTSFNKAKRRLENGATALGIRFPQIGVSGDILTEMKFIGSKEIEERIGKEDYEKILKTRHERDLFTTFVGEAMPVEHAADWDRDYATFALTVRKDAEKNRLVNTGRENVGIASIFEKQKRYGEMADSIDATTSEAGDIYKSLFQGKGGIAQKAFGKSKTMRLQDLHRDAFLSGKASLGMGMEYNAQLGLIVASQYSNKTSANVDGFAVAYQRALDHPTSQLSALGGILTTASSKSTEKDFTLWSGYSVLGEDGKPSNQLHNVALRYSELRRGTGMAGYMDELVTASTRSQLIDGKEIAPFNNAEYLSDLFSSSDEGRSRVFNLLKGKESSKEKGEALSSDIIRRYQEIRGAQGISDEERVKRYQALDLEMYESTLVQSVEQTALRKAIDDDDIEGIAGVRARSSHFAEIKHKASGSTETYDPAKHNTIFETQRAAAGAQMMQRGMKKWNKNRLLPSMLRMAKGAVNTMFAKMIGVTPQDPKGQIFIPDTPTFDPTAGVDIARANEKYASSADPLLGGTDFELDFDQVQEIDPSAKPTAGRELSPEEQQKREYESGEFFNKNKTREISVDEIPSWVPRESAQRAVDEHNKLVSERKQGASVSRHGNDVLAPMRNAVRDYYEPSKAALAELEVNLRKEGITGNNLSQVMAKAQKSPVGRKILADMRARHDAIGKGAVPASRTTGQVWSVIKGDKRLLADTEMMQEFSVLSNQIDEQIKPLALGWTNGGKGALSMPEWEQIESFKQSGEYASANKLISELKLDGTGHWTEPDSQKKAFAEAEKKMPGFLRVVGQGSKLSKGIPDAVKADLGTHELSTMEGLQRVIGKDAELNRMASASASANLKGEEVEIAAQSLHKISQKLLELSEVNKKLDSTTSGLTKTAKDKLTQDKEQIEFDIRRETLRGTAKTLRDKESATLKEMTETVNAGGKVSYEKMKEFQTLGDRASKQEEELMQLNQKDPKSKLGSFARRVFGGFGLMYLGSIAGMAQTGLEENYKETLQYQEGLYKAGRNIAGATRPFNQVMLNENRRALLGPNYSAKQAAESAKLNSPLLGDVADAGTAALGGAGATLWAMSELGYAATAGPVALAVGATVAVGNTAVKMHQAGKDPKSLGFRISRTRDADRNFDWTAASFADQAQYSVMSYNAAYVNKFRDNGAGWMIGDNIPWQKSRLDKIVSDAEAVDKSARTYIYAKRDIEEGNKTYKEIFRDPTMTDYEKYTTSVTAIADIAQAEGRAVSNEAIAQANIIIKDSNVSFDKETTLRMAEAIELGRDPSSSASAILSAMGVSPLDAKKVGSDGTSQWSNMSVALLSQISTEGQSESVIRGANALASLGGAKEYIGMSETELVPKLQQVDRLMSSRGSSMAFSSAKSAYHAALQMGRDVEAPDPDAFDENMSEHLGARAAANYNAGAKKDEYRIGVGTRLLNEATFYGDKNQLYLYDSFVSEKDMSGRQIKEMERLFSGDPMMYTHFATQGQSAPDMALPAIGNAPFMASTLGYVGNTDVGLNGAMTGMKWGSTSLASNSIYGGSRSGSQNAADIWGSNWASNSKFDKGLISSMINGVKLDAPMVVNGQTITSLGGMEGAQIKMRETGFAYQLANFARSEKQMALEEQSTAFSWKSQDAGRDLSNKFQEWQYGFQQRQLDMNSRNFNENMGMQRQQTMMSRSFAKEDWAYTDNVRGLQWAWKQEDFAEESRFMTGRARKKAERQNERETVMHNMEGDKIDRDKKRQQEVWALDDKRFEIQRKQFAESMKMQQESLDKQREYFEARKNLEKGEIEFQRAHYKQQIALQKESMAAQKAYMLIQQQQQRTVDTMKTKADLTIASMNTLADGWQTVANRGLYASGVIKTLADTFSKLAAGGVAANTVVSQSIAANIGVVTGTVGGISAATGGGPGGLKRAHGGRVSRGEVLEVGEIGPERFIPDSDGVIIPSYMKDTSYSSFAEKVSDGGYIASGGSSSSAPAPVVNVYIGNEKIRDFIVSQVKRELA